MVAEMVVSHWALKNQEYLPWCSRHHRSRSFPRVEGPKLASRIHRNCSSTQNCSGSGFSQTLTEQCKILISGHFSLGLWMCLRKSISPCRCTLYLPGYCSVRTSSVLPWLMAALYLSDLLSDTSGVESKCKIYFPFPHTKTPPLHFFFLHNFLSCSRCPLGFHTFH